LHSAKDLLFIQSELCTYLTETSSINHDFLEMITEVMSIRQIHSFYAHNEELVLFGIKSITGLVRKIKDLSPVLLDRIMQLFLAVNMKKAREQLANGFAEAMKGRGMQDETLEMIKKLNKLKRGLADLELDCDSCIVAIKDFLSVDNQELGFLDISGISYCIVYLCQHEEYSLREYAEHALNHLFKLLKTQNKQDQSALVQLFENQIVGVFLHQVKDEMILKTVLRCIRSLALFAKENDIDTRHQVKYIEPLCNVKEENLDFFFTLLSIRLKERQRALKTLNKKIDDGEFSHCIKTLEHVIMPLVDYLVFGGATQ